MLQEVLKQTTEKQHQELEQMMFVDKIMNGMLDVEEYKKILLTNYQIHACFENQLFESLDLNLQDQLKINSRIKLPALLQDLKEVAIEPPEIPESYKNTIEVFTSNATVLGAMYVLEGATLGGSVIVKRLKVNPNFQKLNLGFHYYQVYGAELVNYWKQFYHILNTKVVEKDFNQSVNSALTMFDYFSTVQKENLLIKNIA